LAARLVVPPDFMAEADLSAIFRNESRPDETPPPESFSLAALKREKLDPVPEPYLNKRASFVTRSIIPPSFTKSSFTSRIKQACG